MEQILSMNGGSGEQSYANNSIGQSTCLSRSMPVLKQAVLDSCCTNLPETVTMADLGCSSGPNTFYAVSEITSIIYKRCCQLGRSAPEFRVFLNDLPGNDFNTVFQSLPAYQGKLREENGPGFGPLYVAGVPGSFYGRLFPLKTLHFVHSSSSLHWLSQVPPELTDKANPLINKWKIFISKTSPPAVISSYLTQFRKDFSLFLKLRSEEVAPEGRMVLTFRGRTTADPTSDESCLLWDYLGQAFQDLVAEGLVEEERLDTYNTPYYEPHPEEIQAEIEKEGSFTLDRLEVIALPWDSVNGGIKDDRATTAKRMAKAIRAVNESMFRSHFGEDILDPLFHRFIEIMAADTKEVEHVSLVISLIRKT
ncbi:SAM dependent carboxyl methyltransferase - like 5 [Theobroma cacao]|nr:SAM dependent carboxyl methyltransferase - like 5 [Theobroma cacao]